MRLLAFFLLIFLACGEDETFVELGMTSGEVRDIMGEPHNIEMFPFMVIYSYDDTIFTLSEGVVVNIIRGRALQRRLHIQRTKNR